MGEAREKNNPRRTKFVVYLLFLIGFIDLLGVSMIVPLLPKMMFNMFQSRSRAGLLGSLYGGLQIFSGSLMGKMSDTYGRKKILLLSYSMSTMAYFSLVLSEAVALVVLSRIVAGLFKHGLSICKACIADATTVQERPAILGYFNAISSAGFIIGPFMGGYLVDYDPSLRLSIATGAAIFSFSFVIVLLFLPESQKDIQKEETGISNSRDGSNNNNLSEFLNWNKFREGFKLLNLKQLSDVLFIRFFASLSIMLFRSNFPVYLEENFTLTGSQYGRIMSFGAMAVTIFSASGGVISSWYKGDYKRQLFHFILLLFFSVAALSFSIPLPFVLILLMAISLSTSNLRICMLNLILLQGQEDERGAIIGFTTSLTSVARMIAPTLVGMLQEYGSQAAALFATALALLSLLGAVRFSIRNVKAKSS